MASPVAIAFLLALAACRAVGPSMPAHVEKVRLAVRVPNPCWRLAIRTIHVRGDELLVVSELLAPPADVLCAQVISEVKESVGVRVDPPRRVLHFVLGRRWDWNHESEQVTFVESPQELDRLLEGAQPLSSFKAPGGPDS